MACNECGCTENIHVQGCKECGCTDPILNTEKSSFVENNYEEIAIATKPEDETIIRTYRPRLDRSYQAVRREGDIYQDLMIVNWLGSLGIGGKAEFSSVPRNPGEHLTCLTVYSHYEKTNKRVAKGEWVIVNEKNQSRVMRDTDFNSLYVANLV